MANVGLSKNDRASNAALNALRSAKTGPERAAAQAAMAAAFRRVGRHADALSAFRKALAANPADHLSGVNVGLELCRSGDWTQGLALFDEHRPHCAEMWQSDILRPFGFPHWRGGTLRGRRLLAWAEQGVGDQVMQARVIPDLLSIAGELSIECNPKLMSLFQRSFPDGTFQPQTKSSHKRLGALGFDLQTSLLSAWRFLGESWHPTPAYLQPDPSLVWAFRKQHREQCSGPAIGLSWRSASPAAGAVRSLPLDLTRPWRACATHAAFYCVQYDVGGDELTKESATSGLPILLDAYGDAFGALDRLAAQLKSLDLLITIDNSTAHLAGAVGTPCFLLLPVACDWRWGPPGADQPLYESVRLFRNTHVEQWGGAVIEVQMALQDWLNNANPLAI